MKIDSLIIIALFAILFAIFIVCLKINKNSEFFITQNNDPAKDGKMIFGYLTDPNYSTNIKNKFFESTIDSKLNGQYVMNHPYRVKQNKLFGIAPVLNMTAASSDLIYTTTGVRL